VIAADKNLIELPDRFKPQNVPVRVLQFGMLFLGTFRKWLFIKAG
jgi:hypothetical protein